MEMTGPGCCRKTKIRPTSFIFLWDRFHTPPPTRTPKGGYSLTPYTAGGGEKPLEIGENQMAIRLLPAPKGAFAPFVNRARLWDFDADTIAVHLLFVSDPKTSSICIRNQKKKACRNSLLRKAL